MADIFREVDEDVRKDQLTALWKRYGAWVIAAAVAIVLATAASVGWREYRASVREEAATAYIDAMDKLEAGDTDQAMGALARVAADDATGYAILARFQEAAAQLRGGDTQAAVATYETLAEDDGVSEIYRGLARLLAAMALLDEGSAEAVRGQINALQGADNPWRFNAREIDAILALREGNRDAAVSGFKSLADDNEAPNGIRGRARQMLTVLGEPTE